MKVNIVFLDKEIDNMMFDWIESQKENVYFFLDNDRFLLRLMFSQISFSDGGGPSCSAQWPAARLA